jgi:hypothetical protein
MTYSPEKSNSIINADSINDGAIPSFDDGASDILDDSSEIHDDEVQPDESVLRLYEELSLLRSNPLGLDRFTREEKVQIELLQLLTDLKAPLKSFSLILNWAAKSNESGHFFKVGCQPSREKVIRKLYQRYNMNGLIPKEKQLYLPYSKRTVSMVYFDAAEVFASLLSCPTLNRDEYFLFDDQKDPFAEPSKSGDIGDINTGRCYQKTYNALVKKRDRDMILPSILAMDKTHIDLAGHLQMEPITISHGLLKHSMRSKPIAMRILGYINHSTPAHVPQPNANDTATNFNVPDVTLPPGTVIAEAPLKRLKNVSWPTYLQNEMHMQIEFILEQSGFLRLQEHGFKWNLHYNERIYPVVLHPYVPFIIGDTEGHDRLCGHYTARFAAVKQLCRTCECPTNLSGYSKSKFPHRKAASINKLVERGDLETLKSMSQNYLKNGFNQVRFGQHNDRGIFGACPGEMLHLISLGWFKYCLEAFSSQAGGSGSIALKQYDRLCSMIGQQLSRQSDRDIPRTNFPKGFSSASNLVGHEIAGCLLVKLFALHTTCFGLIFQMGKKEKKRKKRKQPVLECSSSDDEDLPEVPPLSSDKHVADWRLLVSSLLQWHQWMKQPTIAKAQVRKSHFAVQWLVRQFAQVSPRETGMGNNTIKFHLVLHLCEDILDHGVPENVNSAYAESAHIPLAKSTTRNTQKRAVSFTRQAAHRYIENLVVSLASADMSRDTQTQNNHRVQDLPRSETHPPRGRLAGRQFHITWPIGDGSATFQWKRNGPSDDVEKDRLPSHITQHLADHFLPHAPDGKLSCATEFICKKGYRYRAHPNIYDGQPWNDHAMVKWHGFDNPIPALIHTFVDLRWLPAGMRIRIPSSDQPPIEAGVYALVHSFAAVDDDEMDIPNSMIGRYTIYRHSPNSSAPTLYLVDVESINSPTIGIPDIGCSNSDQHYLFLIRRKVDWPKAWDSMIQSCYDSRDEASVEHRYERKQNVLAPNVVKGEMTVTKKSTHKKKKKRRHT